MKENLRKERCHVRILSYYLFCGSAMGVNVMKKWKWKGILLFTILILIDQFTKIWAKHTLEGNTAIDIIKNVLQLNYLEGGNTGAAFGLFSNRTWMLAILSFVVFVLLVFVLMKLPKESKYKPLEITLIVLSAGAFGNLIDRAFRQYVIDFIYFKWIDFPIFNVADCYVTLSSIVLFLLFLFYYKEEDDFNFLGKKKNRL